MPYFKLIKWIALALLVLSVISLGYAVAYYKNESKQNAIGRDEAIRIANQKEQESTRYKNQFNQQVVRTKVTEMNLKNFQALSKANELDWLDKFDNLNKKYKNLLAAGSVGSRLDFSDVKRDTILIPCDSLGYTRAFKYQLIDKWNYIEAFVIDTPRLEIRDKIYWTLEWRKKHKFIFKKWRFGEKEWFHEVTNENKLIKLDTQSVYKIRRKDD